MRTEASHRPPACVFRCCGVYDTAFVNRAGDLEHSYGGSGTEPPAKLTVRGTSGAAVRKSPVRAALLWAALVCYLFTNALKTLALTSVA